MKLNKIQLMLYGKNLNGIKTEFNNPKIKITKIYNVENSSYNFIDIEIPPNLKEGNYILTIEKNNKQAKINYSFLKRESNGRIGGFNVNDVIYLITPDRFADGDTLNNIVNGMINEYNRSVDSMRHGGDLKGIIEHLDYLKDLGITALWINPVIENNFFFSYHGYAATDLYKIDPRFGTNELYKNHVTEAHKRNIKIIFDHVNNHFNINHSWIKNLPTKTWINGTQENHKKATHNKFANFDYHSSAKDKQENLVGWFDNYMPDFNQSQDLFLRKYLIQNMIWWIEYSGLDGIREDTYPYSDQEFLTEWNKEIMNEYSDFDFNIVGEIWHPEPQVIAAYQNGCKFIYKEQQSGLPSIMDFPLSLAFWKYLNGKAGMKSFYELFAKDNVYFDLQKLLVFIDNHDIERGFLTAKGDVNKMKIALTLLMTTRGIPQILYGTEIGMVGGHSHSKLRADFPGGFPNDKKNAFNEKDRTEYENDIFNFLKKLIKIRKDYKEIGLGKLIHFEPIDEIYFYYKQLNNEFVFVIINNNNVSKEIDLNLYTEEICNCSILKNLFEEKELDLSSNKKLFLQPMSFSILKVIQ